MLNLERPFGPRLALVSAEDAPRRYRPRWLVAYLVLTALLWIGVIAAFRAVL